MSAPIAIVDAFVTERAWSGNPAAVCLLDHWPSETWMQGLAAEMNQAETAFLVPEGGAFGLRWFTPAVEVDLCGHATLASAHWLWESGHLSRHREALFDTKSGRLTATLDSDQIVLDFPAKPPSYARRPTLRPRSASHRFGRARTGWIGSSKSAPRRRCGMPDQTFPT